MSVEAISVTVAKLSLEPDDVLVIRMKDRITDQIRDRIQSTAKHVFPGRKVMIVDPGTEFVVLRPKSDAPFNVIRPEPMREESTSI